MTTFSAIKSVHEVNHHKGNDQWASAYSRAGWMSPIVLGEIKKVVQSCSVLEVCKIGWATKVNITEVKYI